MNFVIASEKPWHSEMLENLQIKFSQHEWILLEKKEHLNEENLRRIGADKIFFPHWSHIIPSLVYTNFECIVFHMTDLPYGRGGSPLQNLIIRGHDHTQVSALRVQKGIDEGPVYLKKPLLLQGTAGEIFLRCTQVIEVMIEEIIIREPIAHEQVGEPVIFKRRTPAESNIDQLKELQEVYDYIRMLDADGYPQAFLETEHFRYEFTNPSLQDDQIILANVRITKK